MKTILLSIIFITVSQTIFAQDKAYINFDFKKYDFGKIYQNKDSVVYIKFYFENTGNSSLIIFDVNTTCGCTVSEWTKEPVEKNKKGFVNISFNSSGISGSFSKSIYVKSNADNDIVILKIIGEVLNKKEKSIFNIFK